MKSICLIRHAKSDWDSPYDSDHERGLSNRGIRNANSLRKFLRLHSLEFDVALISDAKRSKDTFRLINKSNSVAKNISTLKELYDADKEVYLQNIHQLPDVMSKVLILGHNPELEMIVSYLMGLENSIFTKFSTASLVLLNFNTDDWNKIPEIKGTLSMFWSPPRGDRK